MITFTYLLKLISVVILTSLFIYFYFNKETDTSFLNKTLSQINQNLLDPFVKKNDLEWLINLIKESFLDFFDDKDENVYNNDNYTDNYKDKDKDKENNHNKMKPFYEKESRKDVVQPSFATIYSQSPDEIYKKIEKEYISYTVENIKPLKIGSFGQGTYIYDKLVPYINKNIHPVDRIKTGGTFDNLISLLNKDVDMAFVDENILNNLYSPYKNIFDLRMFIDSKQNYEEIQSYLPSINNIAVLYTQHMFLISRKFGEIEKWSDLINNWNTKSMKIGVTNNLTNSYYHIHMLLIQNGIPQNKLSHLVKVYNNETKMLRDLKNRKLNAVYYTSNFKNTNIQDLTKDAEVRFVGVKLNYNNAIPNKANIYEYEHNKKLFHNKNFPSLYDSILNMNHFYNSINTSSFINTYSTRMILITREDVKENSIYKFTDNMISNLENIKNNINMYLFDEEENYNPNEPTAFQFNYLPFSFPELELHKGAYNKYKELGFIKTN